MLHLLYRPCYVFEDSVQRTGVLAGRCQGVGVKRRWLAGNPSQPQKLYSTPATMSRLITTRARTMSLSLRFSPLRPVA